MSDLYKFIALQQDLAPAPTDDAACAPETPDAAGPKPEDAAEKLRRLADQQKADAQRGEEELAARRRRRAAFMAAFSR